MQKKYSKKQISSFAKKVYEVVSRIPRGKVLSYAEVARRAGSPRAPRAVGMLMKQNPHSSSLVPCHRVVRSDGTLGGYGRGGINKKITLLQKEGVRIRGGKVEGF